MIDQFTKDDFETYLEANHSPYKSLGLINGEYQYNIKLDNQVSVTIRSSIKSDGLSADVGNDSIRVWLVSAKDGSPLGVKTKTHRQPGWQERLTEKLNQLVEWRTLAGDCPDCNKPKLILKSKTAKNDGRIFAKCKIHNHFTWLDMEDSHNGTSTTQTKTIEITEKEVSQKIETEKITKSKISSSPNPAQKSAIEAPIDQDTRVLAGPGSGKTYVIVRRYKYLIDNGVSSDNILVCTFSKDMADEMGKRILITCPVANLEQISTIHAFCYRILARWYEDSRYYKWQMPKDWQVKNTLEDLIGLTWKEKEKPNAQEVLDVINKCKYLSLTADDSYQYLADQYGRQYGEWLYNIRCHFDAWLSKNRFMTFADMLYLVEKQLQTDEVFRTRLQSRFNQVIIDEAQDTNSQALRILVTISLEPGQNTVYEVVQ